MCSSDLIDEANQLLEESKLSQSELETLETSMRSMQEEEEAMELEDLNHSREIQDIVEDAKSTTPRKRQYLQHRLSQVEADEDQARRLSESHSNLSQQSGGDTEVQLNTTLNTAFSQVTTSLAQIATELNSTSDPTTRQNLLDARAALEQQEQQYRAWLKEDLARKKKIGRAHV